MRERKKTRKEETEGGGGDGETEMVERFIINERRKEDAALRGKKK